MKKVVLAMAALGVLGGGGAGAYFLLLKKPAEAALPAGEEQTAAGEHGAKGQHGEEAKPPTYVKLDPLVVPIMDAEGVAQVISMVISFEVKDEEQAKKVEDLKPRIKDAFITNMYGMLNQKAALDNGVVKISYVKKRLTDLTDKVMGAGVVDNVLLQMVQQNPI
jgi:flagellar protein FliL